MVFVDSGLLETMIRIEKAADHTAMSPYSCIADSLHAANLTLHPAFFVGRAYMFLKILNATALLLGHVLLSVIGTKNCRFEVVIAVLTFLLGKNSDSCPQT